MTPFKPQIIARLERYFGRQPQIVPVSNELEFAIMRGHEEVPFNAVFTLGMSSQPMQGVPDEEWQFAELALLLPLDWPLEQSESNWPLTWLEHLAMFPRRENSWLSLAHTVPNGIPAQPFSPGTKFVAWILIPPIELAREFARFRLESGEIINFWTPIPIHADELALKTNKGATELINRFARDKVGDVLDPARPSIYARKRGLLGLR